MIKEVAENNKVWQAELAFAHFFQIPKIIILNIQK